MPATGYIEFTRPKGDKTAHLFTRTDGKPIAPFGIAGPAPTKAWTYTVVTTVPSAFADQLHDRVPLVLQLKDADRWLGDLPDEAEAAMRPAKDVLQERPLCGR